MSEQPEIVAALRLACGHEARGKPTSQTKKCHLCGSMQKVVEVIGTGPGTLAPPLTKADIQADARFIYGVLREVGPCTGEHLKSALRIVVPRRGRSRFPNVRRAMKMLRQEGAITTVRQRGPVANWEHDVLAVSQSSEERIAFRPQEPKPKR